MNLTRKFCFLAVTWFLPFLGYSQSLLPVPAADEQLLPLDSRSASLYLKVRLEHSLEISALRPGDAVAGTLMRDVYSGDRMIFAAGSHVRLVVDRLSRGRRVPNDHWPWVVKAFTPRHQNYPVFQLANIPLSDDHEIILPVQTLSIGYEKQVHAREKKFKKPVAALSDGIGPPDSTFQAQATNKRRGPTLTLELAMHVPEDAEPNLGSTALE